MKIRTLFHSLLCFSFLFLGINTFAQTRKADIIIRRDSTRIETLILEIDSHNIKYKKYSDQEGPTFSLDKKEVASIAYGNGETEHFGADTEVYFDETPAPAVVPYRSKGPVQRLQRGSAQSLDKNQLQFNYNFYLKKAAKYRTMGIIGTSLGSLMTVSGIVTLSAGIRDQNASGGYTSNNTAGRIIGGVYLILGGLGAGIPLTVIGLTKKSSYNKKAATMLQELQRRNSPLSSLTISPGYNPLSQSGQITLKMTF